MSQQDVLDVLSMKKWMSVREISLMIGIGIKAVQISLNRLLHQRLVERMGTQGARGRVWRKLDI